MQRQAGVSITTPLPDHPQDATVSHEIVLLTSGNNKLGIDSYIVVGTALHLHG